MSRRTFHRATEAERRQDLIDATLDCIAEFGVEGATVRQIAARAGVTGGLIRHYFSSKDQMVQAAYRETMTGMTEAAMRAADAAGASARARLANFISVNLSPPATDPRTLSLWAAFIGRVRVDADFASIHRENYLAFIAALERVLSDFLIEIGRPADPVQCRRQAIAINGMIDGLWLEETLAGDLFSDIGLPRLALDTVEALLDLPPGALADAVRLTSHAKE